MQEEDKSKSDVAKREEEILKFWQENKIFEKSLQKESPNGEFVFYDGPPFATGEPHYGHILASAIKDAIPRYQTMKGKKVFRRWGWDCHGLPLENIVEKELGLSTKKEIIDYGIDKFNKKARETVLRYENVWKATIPRIGRFVDMEKPYKTMDASYTESVWWSFKTLHERGLIYRDFKSMHLCPRCETTLSNFEVNQGYKDITDISVYIKFELIDEANTYLLAWTTTPWTLPGNVALAINKDIEYLEVIMNKEKYIIARGRLPNVFKDNYEISRVVPVEELLKKRYKPLFDYYQNDSNIKNKENGWKVYAGDFVTTDTGTGIVHIAPAFGEDDYNLAKKFDLPFIQHISMDGKMKKEVKDFAFMSVKPKSEERDGHQITDIEIIKFLAYKKLLFAKEKIVHSYPHCWRCDTPLLNYATSSWFLKVIDLKQKMFEENSKMNWIPKEIGENRFGNWIEGARDWAISRSRFWGAPIPVWQDEKGKNYVFGSIEELKNKIKKRNNYFLMRHGKAISNEKGVISCEIQDENDLLVEEGILNVKKASKFLKDKNIDIIICSPFNRTKQTTDVVKNEIGFSGETIVDNRLIELQAKTYNKKTWVEYLKNFPSIEDRFQIFINGNENWMDVYKRSTEFIYDIDSKFENKNILIISHGSVLNMLNIISAGVPKEELFKKYKDEDFKNAEIKEIDFRKLPINENFELDMHRPFIDNTEVFGDNDQKLKRVEDVFDCWYESGSMFYAQNHYPFFNKEEFESEKSLLFPADFIAEGLDQTRGWFYTMLVLGVGLFGKSPYKNVIVNGLILAEDGRKMSKKLKNYPDPNNVIDRYGADSLRYFLLASPSVKANDVNFSEKNIDEIYKKVVLKVENIISFFEIYRTDLISESLSKNILDKWILSLLYKLVNDLENNIKNYELDKAIRPVLDFVENFSTWYIRRSRDRFKSEDVIDKNNALFTTKLVLLEFSKLIAPFMPFLAERIYLLFKTEDEPESVHLLDFPVNRESDSFVLEDMGEARKIVSLVLEQRNNLGIKIRQPLNKLKIKDKKLFGKEDYLHLIKDEVNVKDLVFDENLADEIWLDTEITEELKQEGIARDLVRAIQDLRKKNNLTPDNQISLIVETDEKGKEVILGFEKTLVRSSNIDNIIFENNEAEEHVFGDTVFKIKIITRV